MCGIIGAALSFGNAAEDVYNGLERLEYRGYDSVGMSVLRGGKITTIKKGGRVASIKEQALSLAGGVAIGHTRWATHGEPTDVNAHPHTGKKFSVVHNGIIENFRELKAELEANGEKFISDTDSEVVVRLLERYYSGNLLAAVSRTVKRLKGSFALGILCCDFNCLVAVKYKSPVVVGFSKNGAYVSSDIPALPDCVTEACLPEDGDIVCVTPFSARFFTFGLEEVKRARFKAERGFSPAGKCGYPHYMLKEINENVRTLKDTAEAFFRNVDVKKLASAITAADCIIITGCGTAYNAGLAAKYFFKKFRGKTCFAEIASELRYDLPEVTPSTVVIAVTQSGETADTVEAVRALKKAGALIVTVTNCGYSAITRVADIVVPVCAGAEICVAATKSYTGQLAALYLTAALLSDPYAAQRELSLLCGKVELVLKEQARAEEIARICANSTAVFFLGRGIDYAAAVEASLKLKEVSYVFSDGYPAGELKHGTLALVDENTLSVFLICDKRLADKCENAVEQVVSRKGKAAVITCIPEVAERLASLAEVWLVPECPPCFSPFVCAAALQLIAYRTAVILGKDPDKPRNLAKSVTVE